MLKPRFLPFIHCSLILFLIISGSVPACFAQQTQNRTPNSAAQSVSDDAIVKLVREAAHPLTGSERDYDPLMEMIGEARYVMLGEATHGTHEFYRERARISRRLIEEKGFNMIVLEADWTDVQRVNRYIHGEGNDKTAEMALGDFKRFPRWMWRNEDFRDFVQALRDYNDSLPENAAKVSIYGMDLYGLDESLEAVINYLKSTSPQAARAARKRYGCLAPFRSNMQAYGSGVKAKTSRSCEKQVQQQFEEMQQLLAKSAGSKEPRLNKALFDAFQNAQVVKNAEAYYRTAYLQNMSSWNLRDQHMADTLYALERQHESQTGQPAKIAVWAHNSHQGDARVTEMGSMGEHNVGQLVRQKYGKDSVLVGFTTYAGYVRAASEWDGPDERKQVRPALEESFAALFHKTRVPNFLLIFRNGGKVSEALKETRLERAIGVIYSPRTERQSHYFSARIALQFDAVIHFDVTKAVEPL